MENDYKLEHYERYFGKKEEVLQQIEKCPFCKAKLVHTHFSDQKNLLLQETSRCLDCGDGTKKIIHILN